MWKLLFFCFHGNAGEPRSHPVQEQGDGVFLLSTFQRGGKDG